MTTSPPQRHAQQPHQPQEPQWQALPAPPGIVPESARWYASGGFFQWTDIRRQTISRWRPTDDGPVEVISVGDLACAALPCRDGGTVLISRSTVSRIDFATGAQALIRDLGLDEDMRLNDAAADPEGRLWVGSRAAGGDLSRGTLYRIDPGGAVHEELHGILLSNGICWSPEGDVAYYADFRAHRIDRLAFDAAGHVADRAVFRGFGDLKPDGLTVDAAGRVWVALWERSILCLDSDGRIAAEWQPPAPRPTSVAFGGPDLRTILLTTARGTMSDQEIDRWPLAGRVFAGRTSVQGLEPHLLAM